MMTLIGFELVALQSVDVIPNSVFSMSIIWDRHKIPSSIGRDVYYDGGLILPFHRIAATGRYHDLKREDLAPFDKLQTIHCHKCGKPDNDASELLIDLALPEQHKIGALDRHVYLYLHLADLGYSKKSAIYIDPQSVKHVQGDASHHVRLDMSHILSPHFQH